MPDAFKTYDSSLESPAFNGNEIEPSDTEDLPEISRALYVGTGGDVHLTFAGRREATLVNVVSGSVLPIRVRKIHATGTTATHLVAFW